MANVSGLTTLQGNNKPRNRKDGREGRTRQVNRQVSIRPNASPGQYYKRPAEGQAGVQARQVAEALSAVSPTMGKISSYMAEKQRKEAEQQAQTELQQLTLDEANKMVKSGEMEEYENPYFQEAFQRQYGVRLGLHEGRKLSAKFADSYNPREGGIEEFIANNMETDIEAIQGNSLIEGGFSDAMQETIVNLKNEATKQTSQAYQQDKRDGLYETYGAIIDRSLEKAETTEERNKAIEQAHAEIRALYPENKELLNLDNREQDAILMQVASRHAREGNVDVVEKLLTDPRGKVGAIIDKRGKEGAEASKILSTAISNYEDDNRKRTFDTRMDWFNQSEQGVMDEDSLVEWHKQNQGALTDAKVQSLIRNNRAAQDRKREELAERRAGMALRKQQDTERMDMLETGIQALKDGTFHKLPDWPVTNDQGEVEIMEADDVREEVESYVVNEWADRQVADEENPGEAKFNLLMEIYSKNNNMVNEQWKDTLANPQISTSMVTGSEEDIPPKLKDGYTLYERIRARNPRMLNKLGLSAQDKDTYEAMRIGQQYLGLNFKQSLEQAHKIQTNEDIDDNPSITARYDEVDRQLANMNGWGDGWGDVQNDSYASTELRKIGRFIARAGGPTNLKEARKRFKEEHEFINGYAVPVRGQNVPNNFKAMAERKIQQYIEAHPDEELDAESITVFPVSGGGTTGVWSLIDHSTASPLDNREDSQFTIKDLQREYEEQRAEAAGEASGDWDREEPEDFSNKRKPSHMLLNN